MTGEKKSAEISSRLGVKRGARIVTKSSKPSSSAIVTPPKAGVAAPNVKKDEVHRRGNPPNDMLGRSSGEDAIQEKNPTHSSLKHESGEDVRALLLHGDSFEGLKNADRVLELEIALDIAHREQLAVHEELGKLRQQRQADSDALNYLRQQLAQPHREAHNDASLSGQQSTDRRLEGHANGDIMRQNYELRYRLAELQEHLHSQKSQGHESLVSHNDAEWNELRLRLHAAEKESQERLQQLMSLKSSISSLTRMDAQVADNEIVDSFSQLANRVREWVITNMRRARLDLASAPPKTAKALEWIIGDYERFDATNRIALYQAIVSNTLMKVLQEPIMVGLPETGPLVAIRQCAEVFRDAGSVFFEWRRATIRAIEQGNQQQTVQTERRNALHLIAGDIQHLLFSITSISFSAQAKSALVDILSTAAGLQRTLALQKAQYRLSFLSEQASTLHFDNRTMEPVNDPNDELNEDGERVKKKTFLFCVYPSLEKFGNEYGEDVDRSNILLKARVCCGVERLDEGATHEMLQI